MGLNEAFVPHSVVQGLAGFAIELVHVDKAMSDHEGDESDSDGGMTLEPPARPASSSSSSSSAAAAAAASSQPHKRGQDTYCLLCAGNGEVARFSYNGGNRNAKINHLKKRHHLFVTEGDAAEALPTLRSAGPMDALLSGRQRPGNFVGKTWMSPPPCGSCTTASR